MIPIVRCVPALALAVALAGCGGSASVPGPAPAPVAAPAAAVPGTMVLTIPARAAATERSTAFVSPSSISALVVVTVNSQSVASTTFDVSPTSASCTGTGTRTCTLAMNAPAGNDGVIVTLTDGPNATGVQLGISSGTVQVTAGTPWTLAISIDPTPASVVSASFTPTSFSVGTSGTASMIAVLADPGGNAIPANSAPRFSPFPNLTSSDAHVTISSLSLTNFSVPGGTVTVSYDGSASVVTPVSLTVTAGGKTIGTIPVPFATPGPVVLSPSRFNFSFPGQSTTITATQTGNAAKTFTFTPITCPGPGAASISQTSPGTFLVTAQSPSTGDCSSTITGLGGQTATFLTLI